MKPVDSHTLPGMETAVTEQATAAAIQTAAELTARLLETRPTIDKQAGRMERHSPLFYGTGDNPTLF
jgi:hypothetical protein